MLVLCSCWLLMGKYLSVCSYISINSLLPSLSGGLECIVFQDSGIGSVGGYRGTRVSYQLRKRGGASAFSV